MITSGPGNTPQTETRSSNIFLLVLMGVGVIAILAALVVFFLVLPALPSSTPVAQSRTGLPVYSGATRIDLTASQRTGLLKPPLITTQDYVLNPDLDLYTIKASDREIAVSYYKQELLKDGWQLYSQESQADHGGNTYQKNNKLALVTYGRGLFAINSSSSLAKNINPNDIILMVIKGDTDFTKLPPKRQY
jgi:hypothetical protein